MYLACNLQVRVRFAPDALCDFDDFVVVQTERESFPVPIEARRQPPLLTLPSTLDCGYCFASGELSANFGARNVGGAGRFIVLSKAAWEAGDHTVHQPLSVGAFELTPTFLDLQPGDHFRMNVKFAPSASTAYHASLVFLCDNCFLKEVQLTGAVTRTAT
mgnify:CR=1 FL=1